jgi:protein SCO1/2
MTPLRILRIIRWTSLALIVLLAARLIFVESGPKNGPQRQAGTNDLATGAIAAPDGVSIGGPFRLIDNAAHAVTDADYRGRWMLVFFGYSNCPDECPLTLQKVAAALDALGPLADQIAPLFITVDPAHDTPRRLTDYLANFGSRIVGLTGSDEQIAAAAKAYRVYYTPAEHEQSGADMVSHSTFLYLMHPGGKLDAVFPQNVSGGQLTAALRARLSSSRQAQAPHPS